ncbi:hypothetical protein G4D59_12800 [Bacillus altitudinis]|uniref:hypothetical protein n=1 Tax=Bacillus altitudinis TaxID=293387 RepID=UPI00031F2F36|nr:hypothetical protein [Bacillus altitudinis]QKL22556.1 hypothetical protein RI02_12930 [Bacillus altitudinis]QKL26289.1 hypothetical protein EQK04_12930 [Bacillus altitudinis]QXY96670.1 hypothetical protein G4D59_12800 [Bacillus altitudinis]
MSWFTTFIIGLIYTVINGFIMRLLDRKEYKNRVEIANSELNKTLKNYISEGEIPSVSLIKALCRAYSKSYKIKFKDINNLENVINRLIREIFETSFLPSSQKSKISEELLELKESTANSNLLNDSNNEANDDNEKSIHSIFSFVIGSAVAFLVTLVVLDILNQQLNFIKGDTPNNLLIFLTTSAVISLMITIVINFLLRKK